MVPAKDHAVPADLFQKLTNQPVTPLDVCLAGVELTPPGQNWLSERLRPGQMVWLRLVSRQDQILHCLVSVSRGSLFNTCVNEEALLLGLGRTVPLHGLDLHSRFYWKLHRRLLKSELRAEKKGKGLWKEESLRERLTRAFSNNMLVSIVKRVLMWVSRVKDR